MQEMLSEIGGAKDSKQSVQSEFLNSFLSSYIIRESVSHAIHLSGKEGKKANKSLIRLQKQVDSL